MLGCVLKKTACRFNISFYFRFTLQLRSGDLSYKAEQALEDKWRSRSAVCKQCVACAGRSVIACRISCERYDVDVGSGVDQLIVTSPGTCIKIHFSHNQSQQSAPYLVCKARLSRKASRVYIYNHVHMSSSWSTLWQLFTALERVLCSQTDYVTINKFYINLPFLNQQVKFVNLRKSKDILIYFGRITFFHKSKRQKD